MPNAIGSRGARVGFTMIELLTVMGIIIILMAILLPVVATVRRKVYEADTTAQISRLQAACQNYFQDFSGYPGPLPDYMVSGFGGPIPTGTLQVPCYPPGASTPIKVLTSSENLVLGLLGGLKIDPVTPSNIDYDPTLLLRGPQSLNQVNPKQYPPYLDIKPGELTADITGNYMSVACTFANNQPVSGQAKLIGASPIPEFNDHFPTPAEKVQQHPIIYLRARVGGVQGVDPNSTTISSQYYSQEMYVYGYQFPTPNDPNAFNTQALYTGTQGATGFFLNATLLDGYTPRGKDMFILVSAGFDGIFGTLDDIVYPSN